MDLLSDIDVANARHRLYALLGRLIVEPPSADLVTLAASLPALDGVVRAGADLESLAATHHQVLVLEVPLYGSAFRSADGLLGGATTDALRAAYAGGGFFPGRADVEPDHLGLQLAFLSHLAAAEAEARTDEAPFEPLRTLQRSFLDAHLLRWLPACAVAVRRVGVEPWTTVVALALELTASHRDDLGPSTIDWTLEGSALTLDDPDVGLAAVARHLFRPACAGWAGGRGSVNRICAAAGVPPGFGDRASMLEGALFSASDSGRLGALVAAVDAELGSFDAGLAELGRSLGVPVGPWRERLAATRASWAQLRAAAEDAGSTG